MIQFASKLKLWKRRKKVQAKCKQITNEENLKKFLFTSPSKCFFHFYFPLGPTFSIWHQNWHICLALDGRECKLGMDEKQKDTAQLRNPITYHRDTT